MVNMKAGFTPLHLTKQSIPALLLTCVETIKKTPPPHQWELSIDERLPNILLDYDLFELLIYNLIFHAMEFSPPESKIKIKAGKENNQIVIAISGEGPVIPLEMLESIFEKFYRMPEATQSGGPGLGLAIAKVIAEIHGGELKIENSRMGGLP